MFAFQLIKSFGSVAATHQFDAFTVQLVMGLNRLTLTKSINVLMQWTTATWF